MNTYFTIVDEEAKELIHKCMDELDPSVRLEYLINALTLKFRKDMTVKEVFQNELEAKEKFEQELKGRKK